MKKILVAILVIVSLLMPVAGFAYYDPVMWAHIKRQDEEYARYNDVALFMRQNYDVFKNFIEPWDRIHKYRNYTHPAYPCDPRYNDDYYYYGVRPLDAFISVVINMLLLGAAMPNTNTNYNYNNAPPPPQQQENSGVPDPRDTNLQNQEIMDFLKNPENQRAFDELMRRYNE